MVQAEVDKVFGLVDKLSQAEKRQVLQYVVQAIGANHEHKQTNNLSDFLTFIEMANMTTGNPNASTEIKKVMETDFVDDITNSMNS